MPIYPKKGVFVRLTPGARAHFEGASDEVYFMGKISSDRFGMGNNEGHAGSQCFYPITSEKIFLGREEFEVKNVTDESISVKYLGRKKD